MIVGVPKEIKTREYRVGMVPAGVRALTSAGHTVLVETNAGVGSGIPDSEYQRVGAQIVASADEVWKRAEMIVKVKEPIAPEYARIQDGQIIYTYFHLSGVDPELTRTHPRLPQIHALMLAGRPRPVTPYYLVLSTTLQPEFSAVLVGLKPPHRAIREGRQRLEHFLVSLR